MTTHLISIFNTPIKVKVKWFYSWKLMVYHKDAISEYSKNAEEDDEMDFEELHPTYKEIKNLNKRIVKQELYILKKIKIKENSRYISSICKFNLKK